MHTKKNPLFFVITLNFFNNIIYYNKTVQHISHTSYRNNILFNEQSRLYYNMTYILIGTLYISMIFFSSTAPDR